MKSLIATVRSLFTAAAIIFVFVTAAAAAQGPGGAQWSQRFQQSRGGSGGRTFGGRRP